MIQLPVEDPYDRDSLVDRSLHYVRSSIALRIALMTTVFDHAAALALVLVKRVPAGVAGVFALFSVLAWFFAVCLPVMNRAVRVRFGAPETGYWGEVVEIFGQVVLCVQSVLYTAMVVYGAAVGID
jgi:hypothetical protein